MKKILAVVSILILAFLLSSCQMVTPDKPDTAPFPVYSIDKLANADYLEGRIVVGYSDAKAVDAVKKLLSADTAVEIPKLNAVSLKLNGMTVKDALLKLSKTRIDGLRYAEPVFNRHLIDPNPSSGPGITAKNPSVSDITIEDPMMPFQWAFNNIDPANAWSAGHTGTGIVVAVDDTAIDGQHPDLIGQFVSGYDAEYGYVIPPNTDYENPANPDDDHGTHVSGIIAAARNTIGVRGLAYNAKIMPILVFRGNSSGTGYHYLGDDYVALGIVWAVDHGAKVLSNSWGGIDYSQLLKDAVDYVLDSGSIFVASMGNESEDLVEYPAAYPGVIAVAAANVNDTIADFSTRGPHVSVSAPGVYVLSTIPRGSAASEGVNGTPYAYWDGTSMAAPYVSALAAIVSQVNPSYTPYQVQSLIENAATDIPPAGFDRASGYGMINVDNCFSINYAPPMGGILDVELDASRGNVGIPAVNVTLHSNGTGRDYYAQTDMGGVAKFRSIVSGSYQVYVGGPNFMSPYAWNWRQQEEQSDDNPITVGTSLSTETFVFSSGMSVLLAADATDTYNLKLWNFNSLYTTITVVNGDYLSYTLPSSAPAGPYYMELVRATAGATVNVMGSVNVNGSSIIIGGAFGPADTDILIDESGGEYGIPTTVF